MTLLRTRFALAMAILATGLTARADNCAEISRVFADADANSDGVLTRVEVQDSREAAFVKLDRNRDGYAELKDAPKPFLRQYKEKFEPLRERFDSNGDGRLSRDEFVYGATPGFDAADADGDDQVTAAERDAVCAGSN